MSHIWIRTLRQPNPGLSIFETKLFPIRIHSPTGSKKMRFWLEVLRHPNPQSLQFSRGADAAPDELDPDPWEKDIRIYNPGSGSDRSNEPDTTPRRIQIQIRIRIWNSRPTGCDIRLKMDPNPASTIKDRIGSGEDDCIRIRNSVPSPSLQFFIFNHWNAHTFLISFHISKEILNDPINLKSRETISR